MSEVLAEALWSRDRIDDAVEALARRVGFAVEPVSGSPSDGEPGVAIASAAARRGLEAQAVDVGYGEVDELLLAAAPALIAIDDPGGGVLVLVSATRGKLRLLTPELRVMTVPLRDVRDRLVRAVAPEDHELAPLLVAVPGARRARVAALLRDALVPPATRIGHCWLLRRGSHASFGARLRAAGALRLGLLLIAVRATFLALQVASIYGIGQAALGGRIDLGMLTAWALALATAVPLQLGDAWLQGHLAVIAGQALKHQLLCGAFALDADALRAKGVGELFGAVVDTETLEALALNGGFAAAMVLVEITTAIGLLARGRFWVEQELALAVAVAAVVVAARRVQRASDAWSTARLSMTNGLVETMVGHRTRLAQLPPWRWHDEEDLALREYVERARALDAGALTLQALPRAWLIVGTVLVAHLLAVRAPTGEVAATLGGMVVASGALRTLSMGITNLASALDAWRRVGPLLGRASRGGRAPSGGDAPRAAPPGQTIVEARGLSFRYPSRARAALENVDLTIAAGDRLLVEGGSGEGKSTLGMLLGGARVPDAGLLLLGGIDHKTLGSSAWRRRVATCPQVHQNHVFAGTLAFNLLMGRRWPPAPEDLREAREVCEELGLGPLIASMSSGLLQLVGDSGWQLSHGERSRVYIARALLQDAELVVFDESFSALDPATLELALECVARRAHTLLVIAHP